MRTKLKVLACLTGVVVPWLTMPGPAAADETFQATGIINVPVATNNTHGGLSSFDISFVDEVLGVYLLADRSNAGVDIVDIGNNSIKVLAPGAFQGVKSSATSGPNGVITVDNKEAWAGDGNSTVKVIDISSNTVTHTIPTGGTQRADELCVDPVDHVVLIANDEGTPPGGDLFVTFISTQTYAILGQIEFRDGADPNSKGIIAGAGIEQCKWSPRTGKFYINIPQVGTTAGGDGATLQISPTGRKVEKVFDIPAAECVGPAGMALGPTPQILLGCGAGPGSVIIDENNGSQIANLGGEDGNDEVWYNPGDNQYFLAQSNHPGGPVLGVVDGNGAEDDNATSALGSHSVAVDPFGGHVFVPINNCSTAACSSSGGFGANSKICSSLGGNDAQGCIAIYTSRGRDDQCLVAGAAVVASEDGDPQFLRVLCRDHDRGHDSDHDHDH
jgi:hypothetical protein